MSAIKKGLNGIINSLITYLHIDKVLYRNLRSFLSSRNLIEFKSVEKFWNHIKEERLEPGTRIRIVNGFITEWLPRLPGATFFDPVMSFINDTNLNKPRKRMIYESSPTSPLGVIRLPFQESDKLNYAALSVTTVDSWCCEFGIPIVVTDSVYDEYIKYRNKKYAVEGTIEGILEFGQIPILNSKLLANLGSNLEEDFIKILTTPLNLSNVFLRVVSPIDVLFRVNDSHPSGFLWGILRKQIANDNIKYKLTAAQTDLFDREHIDYRINEFKNGGPGILNQLNVSEEKYVMLTEFDLRRPSFVNSISIEKLNQNDHATLEKIRKILIELQTINIDQI